MLDFNTKKRILKNLSDCAEKHFLMLVPCLAAAAFVKLFYFIACSIDIALSDKEGRFLGIRSSCAEKGAKIKKQDDIMYVRRSPGARFVSGALAFAFVCMFIPNVMPAVTASAIQATQATSVDQYKNITELGITYGQAGGGSYYYDPTVTAQIVKAPEIDAGRCVPSTSWFKLAFTFDAERVPTTQAGVADTNGAVSKVEACYDAYYKNSDGSDGRFYQTVANNISFSSMADLKDTSYTFRDLDPDTYNYKFYIRVTQIIHAYEIPNGGDIKEYAFMRGSNVVINNRYLTTPAASGTPSLMEDPANPGTYLPVKSANVIMNGINRIINSDKLTNAPAIGLGQNASAPAFTAEYDETNRRVIVAADASTLRDSNVMGYLFYRSEESVNSQGVKTMGPYELVHQQAKSRDGTTGNEWHDTSIAFTKRYDYVVCTYKDVFAGGKAFSDATRGQFITSPLPSGTTPNGSVATVYTRTASPEPVLNNNNSYFTVTWEAVEGATRYEVQRMNVGSDGVTSPDTSVTPYKWVIDAVSGQQVYSITDRKARLHQEYCYEVVAVNGNAPSDVQRSEPKTTNSDELDPSIYVPYDFRVTSSNTDTSVNVSWKCKGEDITGFDIRVYEITYDANGKEISTLLEDKSRELSDILAKRVYISSDKDVNGNSIVTYGFNDQGYQFGHTYRFQIMSYMIIGNSGVKEPVSKWVPAPDGYKVKIGTDILPPQEIQAVSGDRQVTLSWDKVDDADHYILVIEKLVGSRFYELDNKIVYGTSYNHINLKDGETYRYRVRSVRDFLGETQYSDFTKYVTAIVGNKLKRPTDLVVTADEKNAITIKWKEVDGADGYYLYITGNNGTNEVKDITSPSYIQTNAKYGVTYSYCVQAYKNVELPNGESPYTYVSDRSAVETFTLGGMTSGAGELKAEPGEGEIKLSWTAVPDAAGYIVYATCNGKTETFNVTTNSFTHTGLIAGRVYTYYVIPYKFINGTTVYGNQSSTVTATVGGLVPAPTDFVASSADTSAVLSWKAVTGAEGYTVYGSSDTGRTLQVDVSKNAYIHTGLISGENWTYYVKAYKTINNQRVYSAPTNSVTVKVGFALPAPTDLVATAGSRQIDLKWTAVKGADGYIVYVYNEASISFEPVMIVSKPEYSHPRLKNGVKYTYMVAAYRNLNGERIIGDYSLAVSAIPSEGSASDVDSIINIKGTSPYGISHSELISAGANHEAFDEPVDAYISVNDSSTRAVKQVLRNYANGLKSFMIYPFDIKTYLEGTLVEVAPSDGYTITFTMPVPNQMIDYRDYITVIHLKDDGESVLYDDEDDDVFVSSNEFEVLPSAIVQINDIWCIQFQTTSCSPFAFVIYRDNLDDISAGAAAAASGSSAGGFNTGLLLFTALPDIMPAEKKTRFVVSTKKRYRIKK